MNRAAINLLALAMLLVMAAHAHAIMAGGEFDLPADKPSHRIDPLSSGSAYNFIGALEIMSGSSRYLGSATALSPHWVLTAGHNVDYNDDGQVDDGIAATLHLPGLGGFSVSTFHLHPLFTGFRGPSIHHDLSLLYLDDPLPTDLGYPVLGLTMNVGDIVTLVGYGRSGYGSYGYTTSASTSDRRIGYNTIARFSHEQDGDGILFRYDFDAPGSPSSLGNHLETIIAPGDSGGPALVPWMEGYALVGVNTFTEGYGGRFGDIGGGIALAPSWTWIGDTTGLPIIPEPGTLMLLALGWVTVVLAGRSAGRRE